MVGILCFDVSCLDEKQAVGMAYLRGLFRYEKTMLVNCHHENVRSTGFCETIADAVSMIDIA